MVVCDYFRQALDTGVTGMCMKPFYTKWKRRLKQSGAQLCEVASWPGLPLYLGLLQQQYDVFKEHQPNQADLIQS